MILDPFLDFSESLLDGGIRGAASWSDSLF